MWLRVKYTRISVSGPLKVLDVDYVQSYMEFLVNLMLVYQAELTPVKTVVVFDCIYWASLVKRLQHVPVGGSSASSLTYSAYSYADCIVQTFFP